jgi:hypothetical protein
MPRHERQRHGGRHDQRRHFDRHGDRDRR